MNFITQLTTELAQFSNQNLGMEKAQKNYKSNFQSNILYRVVWKLCARFNR
jgi:hypothetical protein